jgi:PAS domain S-box-containing protein
MSPAPRSSAHRRIGTVRNVRRSIDGPSVVVPSLRDTLLLRERALQATTVSVTICDSRLPDSPIVWVNKAFTTTTGYLPEDVIGRNPRFLQGADTDPNTIAEMRESMAANRSTVVTMLNYREDGSAFWNSISTAPVFDDDGEVIGYIGIQVDVTDQVIARRERDERLRDEHNARLSAEKAQRTLSLLADVNNRLISCFELPAAMQALVDLLVPRFADGCAVDLFTLAKSESAEPLRIASASTDGGEVGDPALLGRVLRTGRPVSVQDLDGTQAQWLLVAPLVGKQGVLGALTIVSVGRASSFDDEHLDVALDIGRRAALAIEWCESYSAHPVNKQS